MTYRRLLLLLIVGLAVSACVSLITPDIEPRLTELRKGQYTIDPADSSVDFNNTDLEENIRGTRWLNTNAFLEATYTTLSTQQVGDNVLRFTGQLTLLGISRPVQLDVVFNGGGNNFLTRRYTLGFAATGILKRSEFGMDSFIPAIGDDITLDINAEFLRNI